MTTSNVWDKFNKLSILKIEFAEGSGYSSAVIYGNGNNQVAVNIHVKIVDKASSSLPLTASDLRDRVYLCTYSSGAALPSSWDVSDQRGDYANPLKYGSSFPAPENKPQDEATESAEEDEGDKASSVIIVTKYISANTVNAGMAISAGITIPGIGKFDTSQYGTDTPNAPPGEKGSEFKSPSYITVNAIQAVDYSLPENVVVSGRIEGGGSYTVDVRDVKLERNQAMPDHHDGTISHNNGTRIQAAQDHLHFTKKVVSKGIADLSGMTASGYNIDQTYKIPANRDASDNEKTDVYAVFVDRKTYGLTSGTRRITMMQNVANHIDPHVVFQGDNKLKTYSGVVNDKYISVYSVRYGFTFDKLRIPRASDSEKSWSLSAPGIDVAVTDNYGNSGKIAIALTTRNNGPYLEVNGV